MSRHHSRILAMQALCQYEVLGESLIAQLDEFLKEEKPAAATADYARSLVDVAISEGEEIDRTIQDSSTNWELKRIAPVDRNILRVAVCELLYRPDNPPNVVVDEAVELGKSFGSAESGAFINGVLDAVSKKLSSDTASGSGTQSGGTDGIV